MVHCLSLLVLLVRMPSQIQFLFLPANVIADRYLLTPRSRVLLEKLTGSAASKGIPHIFGTRRFLTVLTSARHLSLSWGNSIQSPQPPPTSRRSILPSTSGSPQWSLFLRFPHQNPSSGHIHQKCKTENNIDVAVHLKANKTGNVRITQRWGVFVQTLLQYRSSKYCIFWMCICRLRYPACHAHAPYRHLWPVWLYNILPRYLINGMIFFK